MAIHLENLEESGSLALARERLGKLEKVEIVVCMWCAVTVAIVTK